MPIYDKPMVYYPLATLIQAGLTEILVITTPHEQSAFIRLLGDGSQFGIDLTYMVQTEPRGLAEAFIIAEDFIGNDSVCLILGDNIFHGSDLPKTLAAASGSAGATIFAYQVSNPTDYGVVEFDESGMAVSIEEKPTAPKSKYAIPGIYFYDNSVVSKAKSLEPSKRGELEISDLNTLYLEAGQLRVLPFERGTVWLDTGNFEALVAAAEFVRVVQLRQGVMICSPEEVAWRGGLISAQDLRAAAAKYQKSGYGIYLQKLVDNEA
jgi:glucose-1-phosphate thymidylyltransferase